MAKKISALLVGETVHFTTISSKGIDFFSQSGYNDDSKYMRKALSTDEFEFHHMPCHLAHTQFPMTVSGLNEYDVILFSDIGANTFLLHPETMHQGKALPNRLDLVKDYVAQGGGFCMIGGYLTFMGIDAKGQYKDTSIEEILPVTLLDRDDRIECPQGVYPQRTGVSTLLDGIADKWPMLLGYNKLKAKPGSQVLAEVNGDPVLVLGEWEQGRTAAFASDCAPHWASPEFCDWVEYPDLWQRIVKWLAKAL